MDPKLECLGIYCSADEVAEYIVWFNFWIETSGTNDEMKGVFCHGGREGTFSLLRNLAYPKILREA